MLKRSLPVQLSACGPRPVQSFICVFRRFCDCKSRYCEVRVRRSGRMNRLSGVCSI